MASPVIDWFLRLALPALAIAVSRLGLFAIASNPVLFSGPYSFTTSVEDVLLVTTLVSFFTTLWMLFRQSQRILGHVGRGIEFSMAFCMLKLYCGLLQPPPMPPGTWQFCMLMAYGGLSCGFERWLLIAQVRRARELDVPESQMEMLEVGEDQGQSDRGQSQERRSAANQHIMRLLGLAGEFKGWVIAGCLALFFRLPFSIAIPHFVSDGIGGAIDHQSSDPTTRSNAAERVYMAVVLILVFGSVDAILDFFNYHLFVIVKQKVIRSLKLRLFENVMRQDLAFFDSEPIGDLMSRLTSDTTEMSSDISFVFRFSIESCVRITGVAGYMFVCSWRLALLTCTMIPINSKLQRKYALWLHKNAKRSQDALATSNAIAHEAISGVQTVKAFAKERFELIRYTRSVQHYYELGILQGVMESLNYMIVSTFLMNCVVQAALVGYGALLVWRGSMSVDKLVAFLLYRANLQGEVGNLLNNYSSLLRGAGAAARVFDLLDRQPQLQHGSEHFDQSVKGHVQFIDVHFVYAARPQTPVLCGLSLEVLPGQCVALVGSSGAGKSTVFHLLTHFYESSSGSVLLDGMDVRLLEPSVLCSHVGLVSQEPILFRGSVEENIRYAQVRVDGIASAESNRARWLRVWREIDQEVTSGAASHAASEKAVENAALAANAHDFIMSLQNGYGTEVGERGVQLSGGQKQRIAIARAVLQSPCVLLLDEATSALDSESERLVQDALDRAMKDRTTLVIAHRLSTIVAADAIAVLAGGRVIEIGPHEALLKQGGRYRELWQKQRDVSRN